MNIQSKPPRLPVNADAFKRYDSKLWTLIPLHRPDATSTKRGRTYKDGKRPLNSNWTKRPYPYDDVLKHVRKAGLNAGIRLRKNQLVIDVDPRNGGADGFENLCFDFGLKTEGWPHVITGSGGSHYYLSKPADWPVVDTLEGYPGVEFKSHGRQVVAAGSVHPDTGRHYEFDAKHPDVNEAPEAPKDLLEAIKRPQRSGEKIGGGQYDQEQIALMLATLDPTGFRDHASWFTLMCAVHHASNGDARHEWIEWCISDPRYADDAEIIGRRFDSLHADSDANRITYQSLNKALRDHGGDEGAALIPAAMIGEDEFPDDLEDDMEFEGEAVPASRLSHVNANNIDKTFALVNIGSKLRIQYWGKSTIDRKTKVPEFWPEEEFHRALANKFVNVEKKVSNEDGERTEIKRVPLSRWWMAKRDRYTFDGLIFDADAEEVSEQDEINVWRGFGIKEEPDADWSLMRDHIRNVIAGEDAKSDEYIRRWIAWAFQNPTKQCEVALALLSEGRGTGKGFLGRSLCRIFGGHGLHVSKRGLLTGRFNSHFMLTSLLFADEALWPGHKEDEGALQTLISEPSIMIEPKGVNAFMMPNALKVLMASNNKWVVPAAGDDRRYAAFAVSDARKQDKSYFGKLSAQLSNGGLGAMLHDLRSVDLEGWHPRNNIPQTTALAAQKMMSIAPELKWLAGYLEEGVLPYQHPHKPDRVAAADFYNHGRRSVRALERWTDYEFVRFLEDWGVRQRRSNGSWRVFPPLLDMRERWKKEMPWWPPFNSKIKDWSAAE